MISYIKYTANKKIAVDYMEYLYNAFTNPATENDRHYLGVLADYFAADGGVELSEDKLEMKLVIGSYSFVLRPHILNNYDTYPISIKTYEKVTQLFRALPEGKDKIIHLEEMDMRYYDDNNSWHIGNRQAHGASPMTAIYSKSLIEYIAKVENPKKGNQAYDVQIQ